MKKIFTLISALAITLSLFAQQDESARKAGNYLSRLSVSTASNKPVRVLIDGNSYNGRNSNNDILVSDIRPGYHSIKVYQQQNNRYGRKNNNMQLVYENNLYVKPQYHIDISINRFGRAFMDEKQMNQAYYAAYNEDEQDWGGNDNDMQPMNSRSFEQFKTTLRNESFDNTKLAVARQTIAANYLSAAQVKEVVQLFGFENSKLDIAKYSYKYTIDKNNYFLLNDAFAFSSSKEDLARYIQAYK